jgi:hypothetical protein
MAVSVFAMARRPGRLPDAFITHMNVTKTYDLYGVICPSDPCCEQGKCLGTMDALTCLNVCGLTFDVPNTEYWVYDRDTGAEVGSCVNGVCVPVCICKPSADGRVRYQLRIKTKNPDAPASLTGITICLAAQDGPYVASNYDQRHLEDDPVGDEEHLILPDQDNIESGENVILCQMCP